MISLLMLDYTNPVRLFYIKTLYIVYIGIIAMWYKCPELGTNMDKIFTMTPYFGLFAIYTAMLETFSPVIYRRLQ